MVEKKVQSPHKKATTKNKYTQQRKILKTEREKDQVTYKGRHIKIANGFSVQNLKVRRD